MLSLFLALAAAAGPRPNVLLVTVDTLRADRVGAYGYAPAATPTLDRIAREGVVVEDAVVQVPQTRPSHVSILTGRLPFEHGIRDNSSPPLDAKWPTLATILRGHGYDTGAAVGAYPVARASGLDRGFAAFDDPFGSGETATARNPRTERRAGEVVDAALRWLDRPATDPFFLWVHVFDPHAPYEPPEPYAARFAKQPYDGEVAYADAQLARLLERLEAKKLLDRTLVVVTADHGEGLGDHGEEEHLLFVYDSTLHVPLMLRAPGMLTAGTRVRGQFRSVDLVATVLDLLGLPAVATSGASRADALRTGGRIPDNESYTESLYGSLHFGWAPLRALRAEGWKYIDAPRAELYRVADDRSETRNLISLREGVATAMQRRLLALDSGRPAAPSVAVDAGAAERLAALGYVGGAFFQGPPSGDDPKDKIAAFQAERRDFSRALQLFQKRDLDGAIRILARLAKPTLNAKGQVVEPRSFNVEYYLGRSLLEKRRFAQAVPHLEKAAALSPESMPAWVYLAQAQAGTGKTASALATLDRALVRTPDNAELLQAKGGLLLRAERLADARPLLERARTLDPQNVLTRVDLATVYRNSRELERARAEAAEAVRLDAKSPEAQVALGLALGALGRVAEATNAFREALARDESHADALFYLGSIEMQAGRPQAAVPLFERLVRDAPRYPGAERALAMARQMSGAASAAGPGSSPAAAETRRPSTATPRTAAPKTDTARLQLIRVGDRERAEELARRAAAGEDFAELARSFSQDPSAARGGDLGAVVVSDLSDVLREAAARLAPGQVSAVLQTSEGYVVLKRAR
jgi:arylsulfatase A-like enzyme/tetratricopeptide (TPR) repeat protein